MLGGSQGLGGTSQRTGGLWPLASAPVSPATSFTSDGYSKYGFYSLFAGAPTFGSTLYSHNTVGRFGPALQAPGGTAFHTTHKVSDSLFSATGYTFGAPTPPPGSPYSPVPVAQLEFLAKGYTTTTNSNIIIQQSPICHQQDISTSTPSPKKNIIIAPTEKDKLLNNTSTTTTTSSSSSAFRQSQGSSTFKHHHQQAQYIYQPEDGGSSCMLKLTTLTSSADKDCHQSSSSSSSSAGGGGFTGCSRTNPLEWTTLSPIHVKKEPGSLLLSDLNSEAIIKMEMTSPVQKEHVMHNNSVPSIVTANGNIPVGIAVGRQRIQHQEVAPSGILTTTHFKEVARISEIADINAAAHHATLQHHHHHLPHHHHHHHHQLHGGGGGGDMLASAGATWGLMGGVTAAAHPQHCHQQVPAVTGANGTQHNGTTLWTAQYPAPLPMEPLLPMSAVGLPLQLVREPTSGGFLLFPTAGIEPVQQAAAIQLWPTAAPTTTTTYSTGATPGHVILPPLPPPPLQLLTSAQAHQHQQHEGYLSTMIATSASNNTHNNTAGLITTISNGGAHQHHHQQSAGGLHLVSSSNNMQPGSTMFGTIEQHPVVGMNGKLMAKDCQTAKSLGAVIKVEEGGIVQSCHQLGTISALSAASLHNEQVSPASLQIFDNTSPVITTTHHIIYQPSQSIQSTQNSTNNNNVIMTTQTATSTTDLLQPIITTQQQNDDSPWKQQTNQNIVTTCMSPVMPCLTPPLVNCNAGNVMINGAISQIAADQRVPDNDVSMKLVEEEEEKSVQDASNQTESISDEESATVDSNKGDLLEQEVIVASLEVLEEESAEEPSVGETEQQIPDFSGLDLLSNSILEHETSKQFIEQVPDVTKRPVNICTPLPLVEENLGGLDLLCALAEQRLEEVTSKSNSQKVMKPDLVKLRRNAIDGTDIDHTEEPEVKKPKIVEEARRCNNCNCSVDDEPYKSYKTKESEQEVKKFIASKAPSLMEYHYKDGVTVDGRMNDNERDMRQQLADLQRKYKEKQRELNKLKPHHAASSSSSKKYLDCTIQKKKHRKKSINSNNSADRDDSSPQPPPPPLEPPEIELPSSLVQQQTNDTTQPEETSFQQHESKPIDKRRYSNNTNATTTTNLMSKRRRKVGRPKKLEWSSDNESSSNNLISTSTETIVAKKHKKSHHNLVGYVLAAKERLLVQKGYADDSPPRFVEDVVPVTKMANKKIGPQLKAEARISTEMSDEEDEEEEEEEEKDGFDEDDKEDLNKTEYTDREMEVDGHAHQENPTSTTIQTETTLEHSNDSSNESFLLTHQHYDEPKQIDTRCILTRELLESDRLRVLTAMGGLFYAGILNAIQPPDVYSITLDGERGNRPHIMSREEILRDAIVEVSPASTNDLTPGTRLCAYWSQQYRCLYPGSVAELVSPSSSPRETDKRFVAVEFDDGDNGTIAIEDIRLLPSDYPIIEYDPNPLLSLSKRKRRLSTTEDRKFAQSPQISCAATIKSLPQIIESVEKEHIDVKRDNERNKERKRLKKRKRDKVREKQRCPIDGEMKKKKKRKHKCLGEQCKHKRHHKKHKKHHRRHHQRDSKEGKILRKEKAAAAAAAAQILEESSADVMDGDETLPEYPEYHIVPNPDDEVTMDDVIDASSKSKSKRIRDRQESCESRSKMSAFLPPRQFWNWSGKGYKRPRGKGRSKKEFFKSIHRGKENMSVGDSAVFLSTGRPDRPYIGKIEAFWETCGTMVVKVKWFYHPEETNGCPLNLKYPGALFESPHVDENDVQTISHRCRVVPLSEYTATLGTDPTRYASIYDNNDIYYRAGYYDPTTSSLSMEKDIPLEDE